jgi:hypothetical protein
MEVVFLAGTRIEFKNSAGRELVEEFIKPGNP